MAAIVIPWRTALPRFRQRILMNGKFFRLFANYNTRNGRWHLSIEDDDENALLDGVKLVTGTDLLARFVDERLPVGSLFVVDAAQTGTSPGRDDFSDNHFLMFAFQ